MSEHKTGDYKWRLLLRAHRQLTKIPFTKDRWYKKVGNFQKSWAKSSLIHSYEVVLSLPVVLISQIIVIGNFIMSFTWVNSMSHSALGGPLEMRHLKNSKVKSLAPHHTAAKGQRWTPEPNSLVLQALAPRPHACCLEGTLRPGWECDHHAT